MFTKILRASYLPLTRGFATQIYRLPGTSRVVSDTRHVTLRGTHIKGNFDDLPNLIFFPEMCDPSANWLEFFLDSNNNFLNYRNVWLVDPRNFGDSDQHPSFDLQEVAEDVIRFMYHHRISTATLAGHGFGAKVATAVGCYFPERVTGVVGIDGGPLDHRYYDAFKEFKDYLEKLNRIDLKATRTDIEVALKKEISDPKWRAIFAQNIRRFSERQYGWNFHLEYILNNLRFNKADCIGNWVEKHGIFGGRSTFIFPEYSRWIHLNTNTLQLHKICVHLKGYGKDIFAIQGDENPLNHWMYEIDDLEFPLSRKFAKFLTRYDGVNILLQDRSEIGNYFVPDVLYSRKSADHLYRDASPAHLHHNWRFSSIYEDADKFEKGKTAVADTTTTEDPSKKK
jgi:pimeloyl-ACP methyl ester carboxylesterase